MTETEKSELEKKCAWGVLNQDVKKCRECPGGYDTECPDYTPMWYRTAPESEIRTDIYRKLKMTT